MKETLLKNWNWIRIIRLILGLLILSSGIAEWDYLAITVGAIFTALPIFNIGSCATGGCISGSCGIDLTDKNK